jgi:GT2 family glycosyltransferase
MDATVVIATRDRKLELQHCLRALARQETDRTFEVIVVDDGYAPPLEQADVDMCSVARVLHAGGVGPGQARNRGVEAAAAPLILFTDDDTAPSSRWVEAVCSYFEQHPDHTGVEGPVVSPPFDPLYERSIMNATPGAHWTCNVAYRRDVLERLGGFSPAFPWAHGEDRDLGFRALRFGPIGFCHKMVMTHYPVSVTIRDLIRRTRYVESDMVLYRRHPDLYRTRLPLKLLPVLVHLRWIKAQLKREPKAMLGSPRRAARFAVVVVGQFALALWIPIIVDRVDQHPAMTSTTLPPQSSPGSAP